jgi:alpha-glucosidase (family GH31 glycosyl hydrolase)
MRDHGMEPREPWYYGDAAVAAYRKCAWLRENLLPYIYGSAQEAATTGLAIMRPVLSATAVSSSDEYMFGDDLLVAPMVTPGDRRTVILPAGEWTNFWTAAPVKAGVYNVVAPLEGTPLYLRAGALLPVELAADLKPGESMTPGHVAALVVTPSAAVATSHEWKLPGQSEMMRVTSHRTADGFEVSVTRWDELQNVIGMGLSAAVRRIRVDGTMLDKSAWTLKDGRVVVPVAKGSAHVVRFITR